MISRTQLIRKKLIKKKDYQIMPWKNGLGTTAQIDLFRDSSDVSENFVWRLSAATIQSDGPFSFYPGYHRILGIWQGSGLWLNDIRLERFQVHSFSGDLKVDSRLIKDQVLDLGLIFDPLKIKAHMSSEVISEPRAQLSFIGEVQYIFAAKGGFTVDDIFVTEGDTLMLKGACAVNVIPELGAEVRIFILDLEKIG